MIRHLTASLMKVKPNSTWPIISTRWQSTSYSSKCAGIALEPRDQVLWIKFNRSKKFNAITREMYEQIGRTLTEVNKDDGIKAVVLTGDGEYYSSGNDLTNFVLAMQDEGGPLAGLTKSKDILKDFVASLINLEKLAIAAVNGPAIGIPVTTLPLFDYVIASEKASFYSPFTALGQCPEACSSLTFPRLLGQTRSTELLMLNMAWDAKKALSAGLVSEVIKHEKFHEHLNNLLYSEKGIVKSCYPNALKVSKSLVRSPEMKELLLETNSKECDAILELWMGEECADAVQNFLKRSKK